MLICSIFSILLKRLPQVHRRVGAPGTPGLGALLQLFRTGGARGPQQSEITRRKSVRLAQRPHGDVLRGPRADSGQRLEALEKARRIARASEYDLSSRDCTRQPANGFGA